MTPRFILITTAAILLVACDRRSAEVEAAKAAELAQQRQAEQADKDKIRQLEDRINAAEQLKSAEREAELARVKEELAQVKKDKELAAERIRDLQSEANRPAPPSTAEAPGRESTEPRGDAIHADLERTIEEEEDREPVYVGRVVPETQHVANIQAFYEPLDPYGDWIETDDYGYVFRPQIATRPGWRPYTDGHWVHTNYGWTWQSNEDFGWATYHYGRWSRIAGAGWVWVPGREWGPGWVSWRRGQEHCGWAPLPPESRTHFSFTATVDRDYDIGPSAYVFVALSNFGARSYAPVIERPEQNVTIINKTVNITNITYNNTTNNRVVYNGGPSYDFIRARSKQPVENVNVNFAPQNTTIKKTKIVNVRQGDTLQVAAPPLAAATVAAPLRVKEKISKPKEDKGWDGVDPAQAQKVKQGIAATSTDRPRRPRPAVVAVPPATLPAATPGVVPVKPERPINATPARPTDQPVITRPQPKPEAPAKPVAVEPTEKPKPVIPELAKPISTPPTLPKAGKPGMPLYSDDAGKPKRPVPEPPMPRPVPEASPKSDKPDVTRPTDVPVRPTVETPPKVKRPTPEPSTPRVPKVERSPVLENPPAAPPQRPPQEVRAPEPRVNRPAPQPASSASDAAARAERIRERSIRQENPVVQRPPQPAVQRAPQTVVQRPPQSVPQPQSARPQQSSEEQDKKKKKKEGEQ